MRYAQPQVESQVVDGQRRYKSIMLLNGFAQNTLPFVATELGPRSLAAMLYAQGWDVWLLEYRVSPWLRASAQFSSMDDIAAGEIPDPYYGENETEVMWVNRTAWSKSASAALLWSA